MQLAPDELATAARALQQILGLAERVRMVDEPSGPIAEFILSHAAEIALLERVANFFFPGVGTGAEILILILKYSHPMTPGEELAWMRRQDLEQ